MSASLGDQLTRLRPVHLDRLESVADLQARIDRKYIVTREELGEIAPVWDYGLRVLDVDGRRQFRYESVYFDTPQLTAYLASARGRPRRVKVRTRSYLDSAESVFEVKRRTRKGLTVKHRLPYSFARRGELTDEALAFACEHGMAETEGWLLRPTLVVRYRRSTMLDPVTRSRVTIDTDLKCFTPWGAGCRADDFVLIETKSPGPVTMVDRMLWGTGRRPLRVSKYGTLMAAIHPCLPANKWNRTLRSHFDWAPVHGCARVSPTEGAISDSFEIPSLRDVRPHRLRRPLGVGLDRV